MQASSQHQLLSIIIPAFNAEQTLAEQLRAVAAQKCHRKYEIIVVNNDSTDGTVNLVHELQNEIPGLHIVHACQTRNRAYARNIGAEKAQGTAFVFCDADDVVAEGWLDAISQELTRNDVVAGPVETRRLRAEQDDSTQAFVFWNQAKPFLKFLPVAMTGNCAVSRRAFEDVGGFREEYTYLEDVEFSWRLQLQGWPLGFTDKAIVYARPRNGSKPVWHQAVACGQSQARLYYQFASHGMPRNTFKDALRTYVRLARTFRRRAQLAPFERENCLRHLGFCYGRLYGSLRHGTWYL